MAHNKMLIDAAHPEETRVVVLRDGRVEEFDYESAAKKLLRGNIYLAKVTRVEPSLQAAFVEYGGNRHGFLAFNEIHPDYYQIPIADRQALLREEAMSREDEDDAVGEDVAAAPEPTNGEDDQRPASHILDAPETDSEPEEIGGEALPYEGEVHAQPRPDKHAHREAPLKSGQDERINEPAHEPHTPPDVPHHEPHAPHHAAAEHGADAGHQSHGHDAIEVPNHGNDGAETVEQVGAEDALEEVPERRPRRQRARVYKIQEVIKRRQIILVQVVKEERGNKGAALTTYLSLAGRYTVLMPNTGRGGGISRKITDPADRKRLKKIAQELEVPEGMGLIIRTAGASRTKADIKRDFEYLLRLWESIRDLTLQSTAPALVYAEGDLIKRSIRDLYSKDIDQILVAGDAAYQDASAFMGMLMPSHVDSVVAYKDPEPLFNRFQIERQLNAMFSPYVTLRSGGYIVINQTEALVSVDVNSGRSTREFSIEETALNTNLEASDEIARQLKLRDLAGLIVIDFIDMEEKRNNRAVERRLKEALRFDRARIQVGHISHFGLMEMSRQRLRTGVLEGSTSQCPHCQGTGVIRSTESVALAVLRSLEDALITAERGCSLKAETTADVALYILNEKRVFINDMETRHGIKITIEASSRLQGANFQVVKSAAQTTEASASRPAPARTVVRMDYSAADEPAVEPAPRERERERERERVSERVTERASEPATEGESASEANGAAANDERRGRRKRRRRGRGRERGEGGSFGEEARGPASVGDKIAGGDLGNGADMEADSGTEPQPTAAGGRHRDQRPVRHADPASSDQPYIGGEQPYVEDEAGGPGVREPNVRSGPQEGQAEGEERARRRRRGRRGGRRGRERGDRPQVAEGGNGEARSVGYVAHDQPQPSAFEAPSEPASFAPAMAETAPAHPHHDEPQVYAAVHEPRPEPVHVPAPRNEQPARPIETAAHAIPEPASEPRPRRAHHHPADVPVEVPVVTPAASTSTEDGSSKRGWWQRRFGG